MPLGKKCIHLIENLVAQLKKKTKLYQSSQLPKHSLNWTSGHGYWNLQHMHENYLTGKTGLGTLEFGPTKPAKRKASIHALIPYKSHANNPPLLQREV